MSLPDRLAEENVILYENGIRAIDEFNPSGTQTNNNRLKYNDNFPRIPQLEIITPPATFRSPNEGPVMLHLISDT